MKKLLITVALLLNTLSALAFSEATTILYLGCAIEANCTESEFTELDLELMSLKESAAIQLEMDCESVDDFINSPTGQSIVTTVIQSLEAQGTPSCL